MLSQMDLCTLIPALTRTLLLSSEETLLSLTDMKGKFGFCSKTPHPLSFDGSEWFVQKHFNPLYNFSCRPDRVCYFCHLVFLCLRKATEQNSHWLLSYCYIWLYPVAYPIHSESLGRHIGRSYKHFVSYFSPL